MAEIRLTVDQDFLDELKDQTGISKTSQITTEALSLLKWAVSEAQAGRQLVTVDSNGQNLKRVVIF